MSEKSIKQLKSLFDDDMNLEVDQEKIINKVRIKRISSETNEFLSKSKIKKD